MPESTDEDWDLVVGTNCRALFATCRAVLPDMSVHGGVIINAGSISGTVADPSMALYNASKSPRARPDPLHRRRPRAQHPMQHTVSAGWIRTGLAETSFALADEPADAARDALVRHPAGRLGEPADVANLIAWLASDQASFVTGQSFTIDGGLSAASPIRPEFF